MFYGGAYLTWFANPFYLISLLTNKLNPWINLIMAIFAFIVALSFTRGGTILLNEDGDKGQITELEIGYWLWLLSMLLIIFSSLASFKAKNISL